jgi:regulator of sigma E protease
MIISIIGIILTIFIIVGIHELGHFLAAKALGVKVLRFSIGFGKVFYRWYDKKGTEYVLSVLPFGGYVKMLDETEDKVEPKEARFAFNRQPFYKKFLIVAMGPIANLVLAFFLYWALFVIGFTTTLPLIGKVEPQSIAAQAGIKPNQEIISVNHTSTFSWISVLIRLFMEAGNQDQISIETKDIKTQKISTYTLQLATWKMDKLRPDPLMSLGITPYIPKKEWPKELLRKNQYGPIDAVSHAWRSLKDYTMLNIIVIGKMLKGHISLESLGGPITIFQTAGTALNLGILVFMSFLAFISISIGVVNILPIPGLDGGHALFQVIEVIIRRPISVPLQVLLYRLGIIILLLLLAQAILNDILRLQ